MIIQQLLDFISQAIAALIKVLPAAPSEFWRVGDTLEQAGTALAETATKFGVILPFEAFSIIIPMWVSVLVFYGAIMGIRVILWIVNR